MKSEMDTKIAEYESLRNEISQRLGFQQQLINFTIIIAGLFPPLAIFSKDTLGDQAKLAFFLLGAIISLVLAFVALKQHLYIVQLSEYISKKITENNNCIFAGWEEYHLAEKIRGNKICCLLSFFMGCCEVGFPAMISAIYLLGFWFKMANLNFPLWSFVGIISILVAIALLIVVIAGIVINKWIRNLKTQST